MSAEAGETRWLRGHRIKYDGDEWRYCDTGLHTASTWVERDCGVCGEMWTVEGHDPCLGELPGVMNACCGHGRETAAYVQFWNGERLGGADATVEMDRIKLQRGMAT